MKIKWNGHAAFTLTLNDGRTIVTDPFDPSVGYETVKDEADFVTESHQHHDHNYISDLRRIGVCLDKAGKYEFPGLTITAVESYHDEVMGNKRGKNLLFKIEADGKTVVHLGDLGHMPDDGQTEFMKGCDVLLLPIGGTYTITQKEANEIVRLANPVCAVPMHFLTPALSFPITDEKEFAKEMNGVYLHKNEEDVQNLKGCVIFDYK